MKNADHSIALKYSLLNVQRAAKLLHEKEKQNDTTYFISDPDKDDTGKNH